MIAIHKNSVFVNIRDRYASIIYSFDFENTDKGKCQELTFEITIDPDAFISEFTASVDGDLFYGKTKERQEAKQEYVEAKENKENAILIAQSHPKIPNVFKISTNIDAESKIELNITIEQYITKRFDFNELQIQILRSFAAYNISKQYDIISFKYDIKDISGIYNISIPSSCVVIMDKIMDESHTHCVITGKIVTKTSSLNELVLKYKIKGESNDSHMYYDHITGSFCHVLSDIISDSMMMHDDNESEGHNARMSLDNISIARRVVFVVDRSPSMNHGDKWLNTVKATISALKQLKISYDRYCIIFFDSMIEILPNNGIILAQDTNIANSTQVLKDKNTRGSTNINDAMLTAIQLIKNDIKLIESDSDSLYMNQICLITDGEPNRGVTDTKEILWNIKKENVLHDNPHFDKISIFTFGVGDDSNNASWIKDLNHSFLKLMAINNNGFYKRIKQCFTETDLTDYFALLSRPIACNINVKYHCEYIQDVTCTAFNTLYQGNDIIICGKIQSEKLQQFTDVEVTINALTATQSIHKPIRICKKVKIRFDADRNAMNIERIWAYLKLKEFENNALIKRINNEQNQLIQRKLEHIQLQYEQKRRKIEELQQEMKVLTLQQVEYQKLLTHASEEQDDIEHKSTDDKEVQLAMKYKFVTNWTSMIVVKKSDNREIKPTVHNPQIEQKQLQQPINTNITFSNDTNTTERDFYKKYWIESGKIGEGAFSRVRTITRKDDKAKFVLKMFKTKGKTLSEIQSAKWEIAVLSKCDHVNIIHLESSCTTKKRMYIVVEMCHGLDIIEHIIRCKSWSEYQTIQTMAQIVSALDHMHSLGFCHRNLKPDYLTYLTQDINEPIKISDGFELVGDCSSGSCKDEMGGITAIYASPQIIASLAHNQATDMWSLGVIIYVLLCGFVPFFDASNDRNKLYQSIMDAHYLFPSPFWDNITKEAVDLIKKLLVREPQKRLNAKQVLQHKWMTDKHDMKAFGDNYIKQMTHWQSIRQYTEYMIAEQDRYSAKSTPLQLHLL